MPTDTIQQQKEKALETTPKSDDFREFLADIHNEVEKAHEDSRHWYERAAHNFRRGRGLIGKKNPKLPWKNSSDLRHRMEENARRKFTPPFTTSITQAPKLFRLTPMQSEYSQMADDLEYYLQYIVTCEDKNFARKEELFAKGRNGPWGVCVAKIIWEQIKQARTQTLSRKEMADKLAPFVVKKMSMMAQAGVQANPQQGMTLDEEEIPAAIADIFGWSLDDDTYKKRVDDIASQWEDQKEIIKFVDEIVAVNRPNIIPIEDLNAITVPHDCGFLNEAEWIAHDVSMTERELWQRAKKYRGVKELLDTLKDGLSKKETDSEYKKAIEYAAGMGRTGEIEGIVRIRELYRWLPRKFITNWKGEKSKDEEYVRAVITYCPDIPVGDLEAMRIMEYGYNHGMWPFEEDRYNLNEQKWFSTEGLFDIIRPFSEEYDTVSNMAVDRENLTLSPPIILFAPAKLNSTAFRQLGQVMTSSVPGDSAVHIPKYPDLASPLKRDAAGMHAYAEEIAGIPGTGSMGPYASPPTRAEVQAAAMPSQGIQSSELMLHTDFWRRIGEQVYQLCKQFTFPLTQQENRVQIPGREKGSYKTITPKHFEGDYSIACGAETGRADEFMEAQKLNSVMQILINTPQFTPFYKAYDLVQLWMTKFVGRIDAQVILNDPQMAEQLNQLFQQQMATMKVQQEMQAEKSKARGNKPGGRGGMSELTGPHAGMLGKSTGM